MSIQLKGLVNLGGWIELEQMTFQVSWRLLLSLKIIKISFRKAKIRAPCGEGWQSTKKSPENAADRFQTRPVT